MNDAHREPTNTRDGTTIDDVGAFLHDRNAHIDQSAPQPDYRAILEAGGVIRTADNVVQSYDRSTTEFVLRHHHLFSSGVVDLNQVLGNVRPLIPLQVDPPRHSKYRKLLDPIFAPKRMDEVEGDITRRANHLIDQFIDRGECNFTNDFAELFPSSVFVGLMGLPEADLHMFLRLRDGSLHPEKFDPRAAHDAAVRQVIMDANGLEIYEYFGNLIDERRANPTDDIVSRFVTADIDGDTLTRDDILDICFQLLVAGLDTVGDTLTCFYAFLATHPGHRQLLVDDPAIIPAAVEELLRWETPVVGGSPRVAQDDAVLPNGERVCEGTTVFLNYGAANVDTNTWPDAFDVRFDREVNPHFAFGGGIHRCLGSHLARRELRITLAEWHRRIPEYRLTPGHEHLEYPPGIRLVNDLMLSWA